MNQELENLIDMALADGVVSEKERTIILRKAETLGEDIDEIEMILDGKIALMNNEKAKQVVPPLPVTENKSNKEGVLKKCPSCGEAAESFNTNCKACGYEFRETEANHTLKELLKTLDELEQKRALAYQTDNWDIKNAADSKIYETIKNFPLSNTKENVLEFLAWGFPRAKKTLSWFYKFGKAAGGGEEQHELAIDKAWKDKCESVIMKARFAMKDDKKTLSDIEHYAKELKIK